MTASEDPVAVDLATTIAEALRLAAEIDGGALADSDWWTEHAIADGTRVIVRAQDFEGRHDDRWYAVTVTPIDPPETP